MPDERDLRELFARAAPGAAVDTTTVIRRSRRRRLPKCIAMGSAGALAVIGFGVLGVQAILPLGSATSGVSMQADSLAESASPYSITGDAAPDAATLRMLDVCGAPAPAPTSADPAVTLESPGASAVEVVLTSTTATASAVASPRILFVADGIVVGAGTPDGMAAGTVDPLQAGRSLRLPVTFAATDCAGQPLPSGGYDLIAAVDVVRGDGALDAVVSDPAPVVVR